MSHCAYWHSGFFILGKQLLKYVIYNIKSIIVFGVLIAILYFTGIGCPVRFLYGACCPGCGLTRAYVSLLHGDCNMALIYHPLFILPPIIYAIYMSKVNNKIKNMVFLTSVVLFLALYLLRLIGGALNTNNHFINEISKPVYIDIKKGFIYKFINYIFKYN